MSLPTFDQFREQALARGATQVVERTWHPNEVVALHSHPFDAEALVVKGEMWLTCEGEPEQHLVPGDTFRLVRGTWHSERYGSEGTVYWVGRTS